MVKVFNVRRDSPLGSLGGGPEQDRRKLPLSFPWLLSHFLLKGASRKGDIFFLSEDYFPTDKSTHDTEIP